MKEIATIQTGCFAKPQGEGDLVYLQVKHFNEEGIIQNAIHGDLLSTLISDKHLLKDGDVLFAAKGTKNFAAVFEKHNAPSVASTSFFVIKLKDQKVLPHYLAWFLNSHTTQAQLKGQAIGTSIPSISKQVLENLEIPFAELETQKVILNIVFLHRREKELNQRIEILREKLVQQQIINAIKQ